MRLLAIAATVVALGALAAPAAAQRQGAALVAGLRHGSVSCATLAPGDFAQVGEYTVARLTPTPGAARGVDRRMRAVLGTRRAQHLHEQMGRRYTGCLPGHPRPGMVGRGLMWGAAGGTRIMRHDPAWRWMRRGTWRTMGRPAWVRVERLLSQSAGAEVPSVGTWSTGAVIAAIADGIVLVALAAGAVLVLRRGRRRAVSARRPRRAGRPAGTPAP